MRTKHQTDRLLMTLVLLGLPIFLSLDSVWLSQYFSHGQMVANVIMIFFYCGFLAVSNSKLRWIILLMTVIGFFGEILGSIIMTLYRYRLENIPIYVPLGHAVIFITIYHLCRQPWLWRHHVNVEKILHILILTVSLGSLILYKDIFGFNCYLLFLVFIRNKVKPLFYLMLFAMVYYLEIVGTRYASWTWYNVLGNHMDYFTTANPPCGVAGLYMVFDMLSNYIYLFFKLKFKEREQISLPT